MDTRPPSVSIFFSFLTSSQLHPPQHSSPFPSLSSQVRLKDYIAKKEMGTLKMDKFQKRMHTALQKVRDTERSLGWARGMMRSKK